MASMKEIALGVTSILPMPGTPDPLTIDLWNQAPSDAADLVRSVLAECHDAALPLKVVRVPQAIWKELSASDWGMLRPPDTRVEVSTELTDRIEFWRREPA